MSPLLTSCAVPVDSARSAQSVREDTAELASYFLSSKKDGRGPSFLARARPFSSQTRQEPAVPLDGLEAAEGSSVRASGVIEELSEPSSPETVIQDPIGEGPSMLTTMLMRSPPSERCHPTSEAEQVHEERVADSATFESKLPATIRNTQQDSPQDERDGMAEEPTETAPLLSVLSHQSWQSYGLRSTASRGVADLESQKTQASRSWASRAASSTYQTKLRAASFARRIRDPKSWDRRALWQHIVVAPVACLPAVIVGLLLNILDALSYGM